MDSGTEEPDAALARIRVDDAAARRRERAWSSDAEVANANLAGLVRTLSERGDAVTVATTSSAALRGRFTAVGSDCVVFETDATDDVALIRLGAIRLIEPGEPQPIAAHFEGTDTPSFAELLADWTGFHVAAGLRGGTQVSGELLGVGVDVCSVRRTGAATISYVPVPMLETCSRARHSTRESRGQSDRTR